MGTGSRACFYITALGGELSLRVDDDDDGRRWILPRPNRHLRTLDVSARARSRVRDYQIVSRSRIGDAPR